MMTKPLILLFTSIVILQDLCLRAADYYVAPDGNDNWSGTIATPNGQRTDGPFASLQRAREAVRALKDLDAHRKVQLVVSGGIRSGADVAKAMALMVGHPGDLFDYEDGKPADTTKHSCAIRRATTSTWPRPPTAAFSAKGSTLTRSTSRRSAPKPRPAASTWPGSMTPRATTCCSPRRAAPP